MRVKTIPSDKSPPTDLERLNTLLAKKNALIPYQENATDKEYPQISYWVYGAPKTGELFIKITNGKASFVKAIPSPVAYPQMSDRRFGIDEADLQASFEAADALWAKPKAELLA